MLKVKVGDRVLCTNWDVILNKDVDPEWAIVERISDCETALYVKYIAGNQQGIWFIDEVSKVMRAV